MLAVADGGTGGSIAGCSSSFGGVISFSFSELNIRFVFLSVMV